VNLQDLIQKLRPRTRNLYDGIKSHWTEEKRPPSFRDLRARTGLALNSLSNHLSILEREGLIEPRRRGIPRDIYLAKPLGETA
jgi:DNA-binding transcriptional ArsR family regulator